VTIKGILPSNFNPGPVFNDKEIAGRESEPVLLGENQGENRKCVDINYKSFSKGLVMASLNINSLVAHIDEFRVFMKDSNIDIVSINETKLDSSINDNEVYISGYEIVRKDRKKKKTTWRGCLYLCKMQS
jgi:hypothetical protein